MTASQPHITVCICTFRRPEMLTRLLDTLARQESREAFTYSVVICDNDLDESARAAVDAFQRQSTLDVIYTMEPRRNIALARNEAVKHASGDFIAFVDDDEFVPADWLHSLWASCEALGAAGVLGPVRPHFESPPPEWILKGGFCERPEYATGRELAWDQCRTGNVLLRRELVTDSRPFQEQFGSGGEDKDFFMRMIQRGHVFRWCNEGVAYETVPPDRWTRGYMLRRALLRGNNILRHPGQEAALLTRSVLAVPLYTLLIPVTLLLGQHVFMKVCIRFCDHAGRLLGAVGLNPVRERS